MRSDMGRTTWAWIIRSHGAWLVNLCGPGTEAMADDELWDCASSLIVAKRLAREMASQMDEARGPWRWQQTEHGGWWLTGRWVSEWEEAS